MNIYLRALHYYKGERGRIVLWLAMMIAMALSALLTAYPLKILLDNVFGGKAPEGPVTKAFYWIAPSGVVGQVVLLSLLMLGLALTREVMQMFQTLIGIRVGYGGLMRVRCDLFRKLQELSLAYHKSQPQGDAIYRLSWDTYGVQNVVQGFLQTVLVNALTLIFMAWIMIANSWQLTIVSFAVAPLLLWTMKYFGRILQSKANEAKELDSHLTTTIQRSTATIGLVQAFSREHDEYNNFDRAVNASVSASLRLHWQEVLYWLVIGVILAIGTAAVFGYGACLVNRDQNVLGLGGQGFTVGTLSLFLTYLAMMYGPLQKLSGAGTLLATGRAGCNRVFEVLDRDPVIKDAPNAIHLPKQSRSVELDHVVFSYREGTNVLDDVSCKIEPGQMVAFVGSSGVGKTTLLNLLPRFYDVSGGAIKLDGHDLRTIKVKDVRKHIALVLQESVVLPTSVRENIAYGRPDATDAQIHEAAALAGAASFIEKLPDRYNEQVSESGSNLSGGQKQRLSIARALLTEAPVIIMDEPTSALDPHHEQLIIETLQNIKGRRTLILVSHRLSTVADCDQIFVMDAGKIVERGTHDELVARRGLYYSMAKHQMRLEEVDQLTR